MISGFNDDNGVELDGWQEEKIASTKYGFYTFELFLNIASEVEFGENTTIRLNATTNGANVAYNLTSGSDVIELQNEADD